MDHNEDWHESSWKRLRHTTKFENKFSKNHLWDMFKNNIYVNRKAYIKFKKLTHYRTRLIYDVILRLRLEMSDDERIAVTFSRLSYI